MWEENFWEVCSHIPLWHAVSPAAVFMLDACLPFLSFFLLLIISETPYFPSDHETCALSDIPEIYLHAAVKEMEPLISSCILELLKLPPWQSQLGDSQHHLGFLFHFVLFWHFFKKKLYWTLFWFFLCGEFIYFFFFEREREEEWERMCCMVGVEHKHEVRQGGLGEQKNW